MIDLRSDTLTLPNQEMLQTIMSAKLGDDGRVNEDGRGEDAAVNALEDLAAQITGKEAALLFPTGTLGNTCGVLSWCKAGDKVLVHEQQHLLLTEKFLFDEQFCRMQPIKYKMDANMVPDVQMIDKLLSQTGAKLICIENTHNFSGGYCIPVDVMKKIREVADKHAAHIHMDGARLFHAAASLNVQACEITKYVDSVMFCISKGLGAPIGSLLCSTKEQIKKARDIRRTLGGGMRQAGIIAAPGIYALQNNVARLIEDIENARTTAELVKNNLRHVKIQKEIQSNIVVLDLSDAPITPNDFCKRAEEKGLLIKPVLSDCVRLVFYKGINKDDAINAAKIILEIDKEL